MKRKGICTNCSKEIYFGRWLNWEGEKERWIHKGSNNTSCMLHAKPVEN